MSMGRYGSPEVLARPVANTGALMGAFIWMAAGLLVTGGVSGLVMTSEVIRAQATGLLLPVIIAQLALVIIISAGITRLPASLALGLFFVFSAVVGVTTGVIVASYPVASLVPAFASASAAFGGAALYGLTTKHSLMSMGGYLFMGLIGLLVAMVVNMFLGSNPLGWVISLIGVVLFTVFTAFDVQRISRGQMAGLGQERAAVVGALALYLDFINLFLFFLRLFGGAGRK